MELSGGRLGGGPTVTFLGAAGTVTGSRFLVEHGRTRVLVDCGLFQGLKELRLRNWERFPVDPASLQAVVLTHAHVDHCGYLPALVRDGFRGRIVCTPHTRDLAGIVLPDSGRLNEEEASYANRKGYSRHHPARPLFTEDDALRALEHLSDVPFHRRVEVARGVHATFRHAGHILGAASILLEVDGRRLLVSGDIGRPEHPILRAPEAPPAADVILCESTYGDRTHADEDAAALLGRTIRTTAARGGVVLLPAFAVDRTEAILHALGRLRHAGEIPEVPVFLDSPMASAALRVYRAAARQGAPEILPALHGTEPFAFPGLHEVRDVQGSKALNERSGPMVVVAASGMLTGGRILHHLARRAGDPRNAIVLIGYQAAGTRGRRLLEGARELKLLGQNWPVLAEVTHVEAFSAHADAAELVAWLAAAPEAPRALHAVHGEPEASAALVARVRGELGWQAEVAESGAVVSL